MTINDIKLNELCLKIRQSADQLPMMQREQMERALFLALSDIEKAAHEAQWRLNDIKYREANTSR